jgi:hypothetical protein
MDVEESRKGSVSRIDPAIGPITGGTEVTITGNGFLPDAFARGDAGCRFGNQPALTASYIDAARVMCVVPPGSASDSALEVTVTMNRASFTSRGPVFTVYTEPVITAVVPRAGPVTGGTVITVHGTGLFTSSFLGCRFGDAATLRPGTLGSGCVFFRSFRFLSKI